MFFAIRPKRTGNYKPGPGRPPGRKNNRTLELEAAAREAAAGIDGSFEGDAHAFLASVYKNPRLPLELRILAASRALRVEKPVPVHESPYHGFADQVAAARKLAPSHLQRQTAPTTRRSLLAGVGGQTTEARTSDLKRCTLWLGVSVTPREGDMTLS